MVAIVTGNGLGLERGSGLVLGSRGQLGGSDVGRLGSKVTVNAATGNLALQDQDEFLMGQGVASILTRSYNSLGLMNDDNGDNWRISAQRSVVLTSGTVNGANSTVKRIDWDGSDVTYTWDSSRSAYVSKEGSGSFDLITYSANVWTWTDGNSRVVEKYDNLNGGRITSTKDLDNNQLTYAYDTSGRLSRVTTAGGDYTELTWTGNNLTQLVSRTSAGAVLSARTRYTYDGSNRLSSVVIDLSPLDNSIADGNIVSLSYTYDGSSSRIASISETGTGNVVSFTYVQVGSDYRVASVSEAGSDGGARTTSFSYDTANRRTTVTDALGNATVLAYDSAGNLTSITYPPDGTGAAAQQVQFGYNANGDVTSFTDGAGKVTSYSYDANGNLFHVQDAAGNVIDRTYGSKNELLTETHYVVPDPDGAGAGTATVPLTTRYTYDALNHLRFVVSPEGRVTDLRYNAAGQQTSKTEYAGVIYSLTGLGPSDSILLTALNSWTSTLTDKRTVQRTDTTYDYRGNVSSITSYGALDVNRVHYSKFENNNTQGWANIDPAGIAGTLTNGTSGSRAYLKQAFTATAAGQAISLATDATHWMDVTPGERLAVRAGIEATGAVGNLQLVVHFLDANGNPVSDATIATLTGTQAFNTVMSGFVSAPATAVKMRLELVAQSSAAGAGTFSLTEPMVAQALKDQTAPPLFAAGAIGDDLAGADLQSATYTTTTYTYDQSGLLLSRQVSGRTGSEVFVYDGLGRVLSATDLAGTTAVTTYDDGSRASTVTLANGQTRVSTYTAQGELWSYTTSGSGIPSQTQYFKYDALGRLRTAIDALGGRNFTFFDNAGRKVGDIDRNGFLTEYRYDAADRLVATISYANALSGTAIASLFDGSGNPTTATLASVHPASNDNRDRWSWYVYDSADRVIEEITTIDGGSAAPYGKATSYAYDGAGRTVQTLVNANKLSQSQIAGFKTSAPTASVTPAGSATDRLVRSFYSDDGFLVGQMQGDGSFKQMTYDKAGRLIKTISYTNPVASNLRATGTLTDLISSVGTSAWDRTDYLVYDGEGQLRYRLDSNLKPTEYIYDTAGDVIRTVEYSGVIAGTVNLTASYVQFQIASLGLLANTANRISRAVYDGAGRQVFAIDAEGDVTGFVYDNLGQVVKQVRYAAVYGGSDDPDVGTMSAWAGANSSNPDNRVNRNVYDVLGRLTYEVDAAGYVTEHQYDLANQLIKDIRYPDAYSVGDGVTAASLASTIGALPAGAVVTAYAYDAAGALLDSWDGEGVRTHYVRNAFGEAEQVIAAYGTSDEATTAFTYDGAGRLIQQVGAFGTAESAATQYAYDGAGNLISATDPRGTTISYGYDAVGKRLTETRPLDGSTNAVTSYQYDVFGNVVLKTDASGNSSYNYYDRFDRLTLAIDEEGFATATTYTNGNAIASVKRYYLRATGTGSVTTQPTLTSDAKDATTFYSYDKLDRLEQVTDAESFKETYVLNAFGDRVTVTNKIGGVTTNVYDKRGLLIQETLPVGSTRADGTVEAANIVNRFEYDARGNRTKMVEAYGLTEQRTTNYAYDKADRLVRSSGDFVPVAGPMFTMLPGVFPAKNYVYDKRGNLIASSDPTGAFTLSYYDHLGRKTLEVSPTGTLTTWSYDGNGNIIATRVYGDVPGHWNGGVLVTLPTDPNSPAAMVYRMYDLALGRMPTSGEVDNWTYRMAALYPGAGHPAGEDWSRVETFGEDLGAFEAIWGEIIGDSGVQARLGASDNTAFITQLYQAAFHRSPSGDEISVWLGNMSAGWTRAGMAAFFCEHNDHRQIAAPLIAQAVAGGGAPAPYDAGNYRETLFFYDKANRLSDTRMQNVQVGYFDGTYYQTGVQNVDTTYVYDALGNVIKQTDPRGFSVFNYYDKLGHRIAQADANNYLTVWTYDANGNVLSETRYGNLISITPSTTTSVAALQASVGTQSHDRTTVFTYDENGRRLTETRLAVATASIASNGAMTTTTGDVTITYTYNGLGGVTRKTEANGEFTDYIYDAAGRQVSIKEPTFTDFNSASVRKETDLSYDGLNNLVRSRVGNGPSLNANDEVTTYSYDAGGRMTSSTDATGFVINFYFDAAGRSVAQSYGRLKSDGSTVWEAKTNLYDAAGRSTGQRSYVWNGSTWVQAGDSTNLRYNTYGEVTGKGLNGMWQETFEYDNAGHAWRSTAGDGTTKICFYDASGNQTMQIASTGGVDLAGYSLFSAMGLADWGNSHGAGVSATIMSYDGRNQLLRVREPFRDNGNATYTVTRGKDYNAFEEVVTEFDARGDLTIYDYNTMGRVITKILPQVSVTAENGAQSTINPVEHYFYDVGGRLVGTQDANGNLTTRTLLAGSGYDGDDPSVVKEFHPDGGVVQYKYDVFGNMRRHVNELGFTDSLTYDKMNRVTRYTQPFRASNGGVQPYDDYVYDGLGQRIRHITSQYTSGNVDTTDYDVQGRVVSTVDILGAATTYSYYWNGGLSTNGLGTFGGWTKITTNVAGLTSSESTDYFGRTIDKVDFGGHDFDYTFNKAGWLTSETNNYGQNITYSYYNTGKMSNIVSDTSYGYGLSTLVSSFKYDADGNRTFESYDYTGGYLYYDGYDYISYPYTLSYQNATATYDGLNRMTSLVDGGASGSAPVSVIYEYDAVGNVRRTEATHRTLDAQGVVSSTDTSEDYWYRYDSMNRFVTTQGTFIGERGSGYISRGLTGTDITYDAAGQRATASRTLEVYGDEYTPGYFAEQREEYSYTEDGYFSKLKVATGDASTLNWDTMYAAAPVTATLRAQEIRNQEDSVTTYTEYMSDGVTVNYSRVTTYDKRQAPVTVVEKQVSGADTMTYTTTNQYLAETSPGSWTGAYMGGAVTDSVTVVRKNGTVQASMGNETKNAYVWWDTAQLSSIDYDKDTSDGSNALAHTAYSYDSAGHVTYVNINDGRPRSVNYVTDSFGQVLSRDEYDGKSTGDPHQRYYYFNGLRVGAIGNNGTDNISFVQALGERGTDQSGAAGAGAFRLGGTYQVPYADFDQSYDSINPNNPSMTAGRYVVQDGDTLASIAQQNWGDASLWYLIADANGMAGPGSLTAGTSLVIPNKVTNVHNNAQTFRVYDPNEAIGDTSPNAIAAAKSKKHGGCGVFGQILLAVVAVAVTVVTAGAAAAVIAPAATGGTILGGIGALAGGALGLGASVGAGAIGAAVGSAVSQGIGVATGLQDKFSWSGVALAALSGGITGGLAGAGAFSKASHFVQGALRGLTASALTQGVAVATGLQDHFDWAGVAAAGVGGGVGAGLGLGGPGGHIVSGMAGGLAAAATRSLVSGTDFGDNILATLPSTIANTVGNLIGDALSKRGGGSATGAGDAKADQPTTGEGGGRIGGSADIVVTARRGGEYSTVIAAATQAVVQAAVGSKGGGDPQAGPETAVTADGRPFKVLDTHRGASNLDEWQRWYDNYRQDDPNFDKFSNSAETKAAFENDRALLETGAALADKNTGDLVYYGIGLPAQMALEAVTGELVIGGAIKGYRAWQAGRAVEGATGAFSPGANIGGDLGIFAERELTVTPKGLDLVRGHLAQFGDVPANTAMLERLEGAMASGQRVTGADGIFYTHEAAEATMMGRGLSYDVAHAAALEKYGVSPYSVYHPDVIKALPDHFNSNWSKFWGIK